MDLSFFKDNKNKACSYFIVLSYPDLKAIFLLYKWLVIIFIFKVVYEDYEFVLLDVPYIPGFLAYREVPHLKALYERLKSTKPEFLPDVILLDGNGILHVNGCGLASHLGVLLDVPTIGVSKTMFYIDGVSAEDVYYKSDKFLKK